MIEINNEYISRYEKLQLDRDDMRDKLKIAVEALEFYSEGDYGECDGGGVRCYSDNPKCFLPDFGGIAQAALASIKE